MQTVPAQEIAARIASFQAMLRAGGVDVAIIKQNADLFYFTGTVQDAHLVVPSTRPPVLLVKRNSQRAAEETALRPVIPLERLSDLRDAVFEACGETEPQTIGFELDVLPTNSFFVYDERIFPKQRIVDISGAVRTLRMIKSDFEIQMLRKAAKISKIVAESVPRLLVPGMTEIELAADLEAISRKAGSSGMIRLRAFNLEMVFGHVLSGPNAAVPSYSDTPTGGSGLYPGFSQGAGSRKIRKGEIVSVDSMITWNGYANDQTRNFCIGDPPPRLAKAYEFVRSVHTRFAELARPGAVTGRLYETVLGWADEAGWAPWFMGGTDPRVNFVGHGIGIETDEFPFIARGREMPLQQGMVFAFEPKIIIPEEGIAGLENTYLVTNDGIESLNTFTEDLVII